MKEIQIFDKQYDEERALYHLENAQASDCEIEIQNP